MLRPFQELRVGHSTVALYLIHLFLFPMWASVETRGSLRGSSRGQRVWVRDFVLFFLPAYLLLCLPSPFFLSPQGKDSITKLLGGPSWLVDKVGTGGAHLKIPYPSSHMLGHSFVCVSLCTCVHTGIYILLTEKWRGHGRQRIRLSLCSPLINTAISRWHFNIVSFP